VQQFRVCAISCQTSDLPAIKLIIWALEIKCYNDDSRKLPARNSEIQSYSFCMLLYQSKIMKTNIKG